MSTATTRVRPTTEDDITAEVLRRFDGTEDPRLKQIMQSLVKHIHAFLKDVQLQEAEWWKGIEFLTKTGQMCDDRRQEFILLSDTLGVSMVTDLISNRKPAGATESTVFGPFHRGGAPEKQYGDSIVGADRHGLITYMSGRVMDLHGKPIAGAELDVWQAAADGLYDVQDESLGEMNMRGKFKTDKDGRYLVVTTRPVAYVIFDVLWLDGHSLMELPYERRREELAALELSGPNWQTPAHRVGDGAALLAATRAQGLEGVIAKRLDCPYVPGRRSQGWVKVKNIRRTDVVIGGWLGGEGGRRGRLGALVVGYHDEDGSLRYAGRVGSGFDDRELDRLGRLLEERSRSSTPFEGRQPPKLTHFVEPDLVAAVDYSMWTSSNTLRAPSYKGLRDDVPPQEVRGPDDDS